MTSESSHATRNIEALRRLLGSVSSLVQSENNLPSPPSPAAIYSGAADIDESARTAYSQALLLIEAAADHAWAVCTTLVPPAQAMAPYTCARVAIETAGLAKWLLEPWPQLDTILKRSIALRFSEALEQAKLVRAAKPDGTADSDANLDRIANQAEARGYPIILDRRGRRIGAAAPFPSATQLVKEVLGQEFDYRLLSAAAHGQTWALRRLSFIERPDQRSFAKDAGFGAAFEKTISAVAVRYVAVAVSRAFGAAIWEMCRYAGWSSEHLEAALEQAFDDLLVRDDLRFWRR